MERRAGRELPVMAVVLLRFVRHDDEARHAFRLDLPRDLRHRDAAVDRLAARHRDRVVVEDLVRDVRFRGDRLADREDARVEVGAVAEVLEHVLRVGEHRVRGPVDALAAHLDQPRRVALHPRRHEMATDAGLRDRAFRHLRRRVVRAARAEIRRALHRVGLVRQDLRRDEIDHALAPVERRLVPREPCREHRQDARRTQLAELGQQARTGRVVLAEHARAGAFGAVVQVVLDLLLDDRALLLDHQHFGEPVDEGFDARHFERIRQADLVDPHAGRVEIGDRQVEAAQRFHQVEVRLAAGDDADVRLRARRDPLVDAVGTREMAHRVELRRETRLDREARQVGPTIVQAARRRREAFRRRPARLQCIEVDGRARLDRFRDRLEADPRARVARQRPAVQAEFEHVGDVRRVHDRHVPRHHREIALVRHRRRHAAMVVARDDQHAAVRRRPVRVAVLQRIARAIDARSLAVPHRIHALDRTLRVGLDPLRAEHGRAAKFLVDRGQEAHAAGVEQFLRLPQLLVDHAERRTAIAADEAGRVEPLFGIDRALHQQQADQCLRAGQEDPAARRGQVVGQAVVGQGRRAVDGQAGGHEGMSPDCAVVLFWAVRGGASDDAGCRQRMALFFRARPRMFFLILLGPACREKNCAAF
ncbi:hypothetical protein P355_1630 [Burkholderia cenocepacia KC-01]|nr:hypothetical protein P355_1630 [Burkholderia cenocepacia KC-01]